MARVARLLALLVKGGGIAKNGLEKGGIFANVDLECIGGPAADCLNSVGRDSGNGKGGGAT